MKVLFMIFVCLLAAKTQADQFYVVYEWQKADGARMKSWSTGFVNEDVDTEKGIKALIHLLKTEKNIESPVVILYLKKLKPDARKPGSTKPYINT